MKQSQISFIQTHQCGRSLTCSHHSAQLVPTNRSPPPCTETTPPNCLQFTSVSTHHSVQRDHS
uniref:Ovule protein n=1 Tax=Schistosoma mansoni TaxID=6183 RepID=A0A5K4FB18_SCHMA